VRTQLRRYEKDVPKPSPEQIDALVKRVIETYDTNKDNQLSFDEFQKAYNALVDGLNELSREKKAEMISQTNFRTMLKRVQTCEKIDVEIENRFAATDGQPWVSRSSEILEAAKLALQAGRTPLFLDEPPGNIDWATCAYERKHRSTVIDVADMLRQQAETAKMTNKQVCSVIREGVLDAMSEGQPLVLRLGHTAPDFMLSLNLNGLLCPALFDPMTFKAGPVSTLLDEMELRSRLSGGEVSEGYCVVVTSCFNMNSYAQYLRNKLPLKDVQPIQVVQTSEKCALVLKSGLDIEDVDDALDEMDRLADLL